MTAVAPTFSHEGPFFRVAGNHILKMEVMKSSFSKQYEVNPQADGSVELVVKASRSGAFGKASAPGAVAIFLIAVYIGLFIGMLYLGQTTVGGRFIEHRMGTVALLALAGPALVLKFAFGAKKTVILLKPAGLSFANGSKQLASNDVKSFGVMTESVSSNNGHAESAYVYADALGQRIKLTGHMKNELATAIRDEIVEFYSRR